MTPLYEVVVIGAGAAGMSAATNAANLGARVLLIDERPPWSTERTSESPELRQLRADLAVSDAAVRAGSMAWAIWPGYEIGLKTPTSTELVRAKRVILAAGSIPVVRSFPGSDLPGVMTGDGLLRMLRDARVWPGGRRVAIVGNDSAGFGLVESAVLDSGGEVVARIESDPVVSSRDGVVSSVGAADGDQSEVDIVALCWGRQPDVSLALMLECVTGYSAELGGFVPVRSTSMETTKPGVYVCGDCAGIGSLEDALIEGRLAGAAAAVSLGLFGDDDLAFQQTRLRAENRARVRAADVISASWRQHAIASVRAGELP